MAAGEQDVVVGIDMGGTRTRLAVALPTGEIVETFEGGPGNPVKVGAPKATENLIALLEQAFPKGTRRTVLACCAGMAGRSHPSAEGILRAAFAGFPVPRARLLTEDGSIALHAAFGLGDGVLLMAGTGSGVLARGRQGSVRVGGWGPVLGDEGSANDIGLEALRALAKAEDGRLPATSLRERILETLEHRELRMLPFLIAQGRVDVPALFPVVNAAAREGDGVAVAILQDAGRRLAACARCAIERARVRAGAGLATAGSVLGQSVILRDAVLAELASGPAGLVPGPHVDEPVLGAVAMAVDALSARDGTVPPQW